MSYRRSERAAELERRWRAFADERAEVFSAAGLPGAFSVDRRRFEYFLMHGVAPDGDPLRLEGLSPSERCALDALVDQYVHRFDDPGLVPGLRRTD